MSFWSAWALYSLSLTISALTSTGKPNIFTVLCFVHQVPSQGAFGLVTHDQNGGAGIVQVLPQMMDDAAAFAHARTRHDDGRQGAGVEQLGLVHGVGVLDEAVAKGVAFAGKFLEFPVQKARYFENSRVTRSARGLST